MYNARTIVTVAAAVVMSAPAAGAAAADIVNARITRQPVAGTLAAAIGGAAKAASEPEWVAWEVPANESGAKACCSWTDGGVTQCGCTLDGRQGVSLEGRKSTGTAALEAAENVVVFVRVQSGAMDRISAFSAACEVDAGGRDVLLLTGVRPADSVAWLADTAASDRVSRRVSSGALSAMAFHAASEADVALERLALGPATGKVAEDAVFWMGASRGRTGFEGVRRVLAKATTDTLRERAVFALSISKEAEAVPTLIDAAKNSASSKVRGQALFWLGQKAGAKVAGTLAEAVENDPDTKVKTQAVFALSQLPPEEGVPMLIQIAKTNRNAAVRKQAMFWLGQSKDARALAFFEEVLIGKR